MTHLWHQLQLMDELHVGGLLALPRGPQAALLREQGPALLVRKVEHGPHRSLELPHRHMHTSTPGHTGAQEYARLQRCSELSSILRARSQLWGAAFACPKSATRGTYVS